MRAATPDELLRTVTAFLRLPTHHLPSLPTHLRDACRPPPPRRRSAAATAATTAASIAAAAAAAASASASASPADDRATAHAHATLPAALAARLEATMAPLNELLGSLLLPDATELRGAVWLRRPRRRRGGDGGVDHAAAAAADHVARAAATARSGGGGGGRSSSLGRLAASVAGGLLRTVSAGEAVDIDACASGDTDAPRALLNFSWSYRDADNASAPTLHLGTSTDYGLDLPTASGNPRNCFLSVSELEPGRGYTFGVAVSLGVQTASASVEVRVAQATASNPTGQLPLVTIAPLTVPRQNANARGSSGGGGRGGSGRSFSHDCCG